jgi:hypothetical protein
MRWCLVDGGMRRMPLDPEPTEDGNVYVLRHDGGTPVVKVVATPDKIPEGFHRYKSHFATCPDADDWRKKKT